MKSKASNDYELEQLRRIARLLRTLDGSKDPIWDFDQDDFADLERPKNKYPTPLYEDE